MDNLLRITMHELLDLQVQKNPEHMAVIYHHEGIRWSYKEFQKRVRQTAKGLLKLGVEKGDHVAIWATNVPEWILLQFASAEIGAVLVTVNTNYKTFELEYLLKQSDTKVLVMTKGTKTSNYIEYVNKLCPDLTERKPGELINEDLPELKEIVYVGNDKMAGAMNWDDMVLGGAGISDEELAAISETLDCDDVINMQYTSGTTGFPKGVMLTHYNIINNGLAIGDCMKFTEKDILCIPVPLFHCFGCVLGVLASVTHSSTMVIVDHFNPVVVLEAVQGEKCTALHGVPTMFISILDQKNFDSYDLSSLRTGIMAGSPCPIEVMKEVVEKMNMKDITIAYGQTEASPVVTQTTTDDPIEKRVSTVGRELPGVSVKIVDAESGEDLGPHIQGEIVARGYGIMKGYYKMPDATKAAIDEDGWLHTGDLGIVDENGYFKVTGRLKDMIIRGGENIYPREIEEFLYTHPAVKDVQVVGVPDIKYGEEVLACILLQEDLESQPTKEEMIEYVKNGISKFKTPRYIEFVKSFPMTASGKIQKYKLREQAIINLGLEEASKIVTA